MAWASAKLSVVMSAPNEIERRVGGAREAGRLLAHRLQKRIDALSGGELPGCWRRLAVVAAMASITGAGICDPAGPSR